MPSLGWSPYTCACTLTHKMCDSGGNAVCGDSVWPFLATSSFSPVQARSTSCQQVMGKQGKQCRQDSRERRQHRQQLLLSPSPSHCHTQLPTPWQRLQRTRHTPPLGRVHRHDPTHQCSLWVDECDTKFMAWTAAAATPSSTTYDMTATTAGDDAAAWARCQHVHTPSCWMLTKSRVRGQAFQGCPR